MEFGTGLYGWDIFEQREVPFFFFGEKKKRMDGFAWVIWRLKRSEGGGFLFRKPR